jgi:hypothetical protein
LPRVNRCVDFSNHLKNLNKDFSILKLPLITSKTLKQIESKQNSRSWTTFYIMLKNKIISIELPFIRQTHWQQHRVLWLECSQPNTFSFLFFYDNFLSLPHGRGFTVFRHNFENEWICFVKSCARALDAFLLEMKAPNRSCIFMISFYLKNC